MGFFHFSFIAIIANRDRSSPLEKREDLLGRCLRLMTCVYFPRLKDSVGELMFAICDEDGESLLSLCVELIV